MKQVAKFGDNSILHLKRFLSDNQPRCILLVTGKNSFFDSGAFDKLEPILSPFKYIRFYDFEDNPQVKDVERGIELFDSHSCDLIIAVGGGSTIDMAKLINIFHPKKGDISPYILSGETGTKVVPFVALPTTSGTGSEATHFAVAYVNKNKYSVASNHLLPDLVIIDPTLTFSAPPYLTAVTGLDAFAQAIESLWSVNSSDESQKYSLNAVKIIWDSLPSAVIEKSKKARLRMSEASHLAGKAINIAKTTAPHAFSYPFTSSFHIPHGHAVSLTLPYFLRYNFHVSQSDCNDPRGSSYVRSKVLELLSCMDASNIDTGVQKMERFIENLGVDLKLSKLGISPNQMKTEIIDKVNIERLNNNPRIVNREAIHSYLSEQ